MFVKPMVATKARRHMSKAAQLLVVFVPAKKGTEVPSRSCIMAPKKHLD